MKNKIKNKKGFSLVELVIVIAIIGIVAGLVVPVLGGQIRHGQLRADRQTALVLTNACKRAAVENSLNAGMNGYQKIAMIYTETTDDRDVFEENGIIPKTVKPQTPAARFAYNSKTNTVKLFLSGEALGDYKELVNAKGIINALPL